MPIDAKIALVEQLWDEIGDATAELPLPERVDAFAEQRWREHQATPEAAVSHDEVWRRIENRRG